MGTTTVQVTDMGVAPQSLCGQIYRLAPRAVVFFDCLQDIPGNAGVCMSLREMGMPPLAYSILETLSGITGLGFKIGRGAWGEAVKVDA